MCVTPELGADAWLTLNPWHLLRCDDGCIALTEAGKSDVSLTTLHSDLFALEYVAGCAIKAPVFYAMNQEGKVVGAVGLARVTFSSEQHRSPVPRWRPTKGCWAAPLFRLVSQQTADVGSAVSTALSGYSDSLHGHIHRQYMSAQVALEAFCKSTMPRKDDTAATFVRSTDDWKSWVSEQEPAVRALALDDESATILINKLRSNVFQRPTGEIVARAFQRWEVQLPTTVVREVSRRNSVVHSFVMYDEVTGDIDEASERLAIVQTLLAMAIAKFVGYSGPLVGWKLDDLGYADVPEFWNWEDSEEAHQHFTCQPSRARP